MASQYYSLKYDSQTRKYQRRRLTDQMEEDLTQGSQQGADGKRDMKVTIVQYENMQDSVWDGEALYAQWDRDTGEFVIRGDTDTRKCAEAVANLAAKRKLLVEIEDNGPGQFVWRGYIGSAEFLSFDSDEVECALVMMLDDWLGVVPQFSKN